MIYGIRKFTKLVPLLVAVALLASTPAVVVGQLPEETFARDPAKDFDFSESNADPRGIWSDGTTMWVADSDDRKIYAYALATGERDSSKDFNTLAEAGNTYPGAIWSDGITMWIANTSSVYIDGDFIHKIFAYNLESKLRDPEKDLNNLVSDGAFGPQGICSDGATMWVHMSTDDHIYAYDLQTTAREDSNDFITLPTVGGPGTIWCDLNTMWVDYSAFGPGRFQRIYAFDITTKQRDTVKDFYNLEVSVDGMWSNQTSMWILQVQNIQAYNLNSQQRESENDIELYTVTGNDAPRDIWTDGATVWILDRADGLIYAYDKTKKRRDATKDIDLKTPLERIYGNYIWSDGATMWVMYSNKAVAFNMSTKRRDASKDIDLLVGDENIALNGLWSDGTTMWVANVIYQTGVTDSKIQAYDVSTGERDLNKDIDISEDVGGGGSHGIWSDGTTMWVTQSGDTEIYAYNLVSGHRDTSKIYNNLRDEGIDEPLGLGSDGTTMWVVDWRNDRILAYNAPPGTRAPKIVPIATPGKTAARSGDSEEPEPPPPSAVKAHCIADTEADSEGGSIELGGLIKDRWIGGCPSVTGGGRLAKYYTFSIPHTTTVEIALGSHFDDFLVLRRGDLGGTLVARDDDSGPGNDSRIETTLPAGDYTIEATTFYVQGVEGDFTLSAYASDRILYSGYPGFASGEESTAYSQGASYLDIRIVPTLPLPTMQIWVSDRDGFGPGQLGAAEKLLQGRIESDAGSPGSIMLAVPNGVWVDHGGITVETAISVGGEWKPHSAADEQKLLGGGGGIFGFLQEHSERGHQPDWGQQPAGHPGGMAPAPERRTDVGGRRNGGDAGTGRKRRVAHLPGQLRQLLFPGFGTVAGGGGERKAGSHINPGDTDGERIRLGGCGVHR